MTDRIAFTVPGLPRPKGRPRAVAKLRPGAGGAPEPYVMMVTPADTQEHEAQVRAAFRRRYPEHRPWSGPIMLRFTAIFPIPQSWPRRLKEAAQRGELYHTSKPDKDNIEKLIVDALNLIAFHDDSQVQGGGVKRYGAHPRLEVQMDLLTGQAELTARQDRARDKAAQARLDLRPSRPVPKVPTKSDLKVPADLSAFPAHTRTLIERALEREAAATRSRKR
jgi:Holliday junction resolvase RusA-like endonuclease